MFKKSILLGLIVAGAAYYYTSMKPKLKPSRIIQISSGKMQGVISYSRGGKEIHSYLGIPFALPPLGPLRFEPPQLAAKWEGIRDVSKMGPKCLQVDIITQQFYGEEDCLYLNVYVPEVKTKGKLLPVMVWIHGGIFMYGGADLFGSKYFADEEVMLVTISYRLASLGFLNTGDDGLIRGNMGLKDQVLSLKWVQSNIEAFGGDPKNVIIFGESAGACSTHLHMLSKQSKGLFHKAISQSGTAITPFVLTREPQEQAKRFAAKLNCPTDDSQAMIKCLKGLKAETLAQVHHETADLLHEGIAIFTPTVELPHPDAFLTEDPHDSLREGRIISKVPWISGINSEEGLILSAALVRNATILKEMQKNWNDVAPKFFFYHRNDTFSKKLRKHYFGKSKVGKADNLNKFTNMLSDRAFFWPVSESASLQSKVSPVYLYFYSHVGDFSLAHSITLFRGRFHYVIEIAADLVMAWINRHVLGKRHHHYGCCHADEQFIQFDTPISYFISEKDGEQYKMSRDFVKLWADFAKDKNELNFRGVKWTPVQPDKKPLRYLMIDMSYGMIDEPFEKRISYWRDNYIV